MRNLFTFCILIFLSLSIVKAQNASPQQAFSVGEKLSYDVTYKFGFFRMKAAEVHFEVKKGGGFSQKIEVTGNTLPSYEWFYLVRDTLWSEIETEPLTPLRYYQKSLEGSYQESFFYNFDKDKKLIYTEREKPKEKKIFDSLQYKKRVFDIISAGYYLRSQDFSFCKIGDTMEIDVILSCEIFTIKYIYEGRETIKMRDGKELKSLRFSAKMIEGTIFDANDIVYVWVSNDYKHTPLKVKAGIFIGAVEVYLSEKEQE